MEENIHLKIKNIQTIIFFLVERNATFEIPDHLDRTPLHLASSFRNLEAIQLFLEKGANINAVAEKDGLRTPLIYAIDQKKFLPILSSLFLRSSNPFSILDRWNITNLINNVEDTLNITLWIDQIVQTKVIENSKLNIILSKWTEKIIQPFLSRNNCNLNHQDIFGKTILHIISDYGDSNLLSKLLPLKIDPNIQNKEGWNPIFCAISRGNDQIVSQLFPKSNLFYQDRFGRNIMEIIEKLLPLSKKFSGYSNIFSILSYPTETIISSEENQDKISSISRICDIEIASQISPVDFLVTKTFSQIWL